MKQLVEFILEGILGEKVGVDEIVQSDFTTYLLLVPKSKVGIVIGKKGNTINSIRYLLGVSASNQGIHHKFNLEIKEVEN